MMTVKRHLRIVATGAVLMAVLVLVAAGIVVLPWVVFGPYGVVVPLGILVVVWMYMAGLLVEATDAE